MEPKPLIPDNENNHDVCSVIRETFQLFLCKAKFPNNLLQNFQKYNVDEENPINVAAENAKATEENYVDLKEKVSYIEHNIMIQSGLDLIREDEIKGTFQKNELMKLNIMDNNRVEHISKTYLNQYGLLETRDLLPERIIQSIDFRFNKTLHLCKECQKRNVCEGAIKSHKTKLAEITRTKQIRQKKPPTIAINETKSLLESYQKKTNRTFTTKPELMQFHNCEIGDTYTRYLKILNSINQQASFKIESLPSDESLKVSCNHFKSIAPGMSTVISIQYNPTIYQNFENTISIRSSNNEIFIIPIEVYRSPPVLNTYIFRSIKDIFTTPTNSEEDNFSFKRCIALNSSIDCGSCLLGTFNVLSIIIENKGNDGRFFIITEDEWSRMKICNISESLEFKKDEIWLYPAYFEIKQNEIIEISVIFQPTSSGLYTEMLYFICDNNSFQEIEFIGDSVLFDKNLVTIKLFPCGLALKNEGQCLNLGCIIKDSPFSLCFNVYNNSPVDFLCYWLFKNCPEDSSASLCNLDHVQMKNQLSSLRLAPYTSNDFVFEITSEVEKEGLCGMTISLFIADVPVNALHEKEDFKIIDKGIPGLVDVEIREIEIMSFVDSCSPHNKPIKSTKKTPEKYKEKREQKKIRFTTRFIHFGLVPIGVNVSKDIYIESLTDDPIQWKIIEIKINADYSPYSEILDECENLSRSTGNFSFEHQLTRTSYKIVNKGSMRHVSVLLLLSSSKKNVLTEESYCFVVYEIVQSEIYISTPQSNLPILCPFEVFNVDVPKEFTIYIENFSMLTGCFYFLQPHGEDVTRLTAEVIPQKGTVKPLKIRKVTVKITAHQVGIFENYFLPCFVGIDRPPINLRIMTVVDYTYVYFYLPNDTLNDFRTVLWPPKIVYEQDHEWDYCICDEKTICEERIDSENTSTESIVKEDLVNVLKGFKREFSVEKQVVQIYDIPLRQPVKVSFYIENLTPVENVSFKVETKNFPTSQCNRENIELRQLINSFKVLKTEEQIWSDLCDHPYGILIECEKSYGQINANDISKDTLFIYAKTWGIYLDEITVELQDLPCFTFSIILEVLKTPIEFPFALKTSKPLPTINFGYVSMNSANILRKILVKNTSTIPVTVIWRLYSLFSSNSCKSFIGPENQLEVKAPETKSLEPCLLIHPTESYIEENSTTLLDINLQPRLFPQDINAYEFKFFVVGDIQIEDKNRSKVNYFYRKQGDDLEQIQLNIEGIIETPSLTLSKAESRNCIELYATEIASSPENTFQLLLVLLNNKLSSTTFSLQSESPFLIDTNRKVYSLEPKQKQKVKINCMFYPEDVHDLYERAFVTTANRAELCVHKKSVKISKKLFVHHLDCCTRMVNCESFDLTLIVHYPVLFVQPQILKFCKVRTGCTKTSFISIYNESACEVPIRVKLGEKSTNFTVFPPYGVIKATTGVNKQFLDIFVYFSPEEEKAYVETLTVCTNVKQDEISVQLTGFGSLDEKYYCYKK